MFRIVGFFKLGLKSHECVSLSHSLTIEQLINIYNYCREIYTCFFSYGNRPIFYVSLFLPTADRHDHEDDSDMFMEADELPPPPEYSVVRSESRVVRTYSHSPSESSDDHGASISRVEHYEPEVVVSSSQSDPQNPTAAEQKFFPSYLSAVPLGRPIKLVSSSVAASIAGRYGRGFDPTILGSGDFSVLHGGTFYPDEESKYHQKSSFETYFKNGHGGKPYAEALTAKKDGDYPEDPFEHFKDFADINTGGDAAFSHFMVIYANKNSTKPHPSHPSPKNIFEQLQLLDIEKQQEQNTAIPVIATTEAESEEKEEKPDKKLMKLSKFKSKLSKMKVVKKYKKKLGPKIDYSSPDYADPLLAMS
jgi:hypothetical protein